MSVPNRPVHLSEDVLEALYLEAAQDTDAEAEARSWIEAVPDDALEPGDVRLG